MKRKESYRHRTRSHSWFLLAAASMIIAAAPLASSAQELATPSETRKNEDTKAPDKPSAPVFSGPQTGEEIRPFKVLHIQAEETRELEVAEKISDDHTTLICFVHKLSNDDRILYGLGLVDFYAKGQKDLSSHFVLVSDEREKLTRMLRGWARGSVFKNSIVSLSADGANGPGYYGLNRNVAMTVVVARGNKVVDNLVFNAPNGKDLQKIMTAVAKASGKPAPNAAKIQKELRAERQRQRDKVVKASPVFKAAPNEELGRMMFVVVNGRGNRTLVAKRFSKRLVDWAGDDEKRQATLKNYCKELLAGKFKLDRYAREALEKLAAN